MTKRTFHHKDPLCAKFFAALALHDIIHETPLAEVRASWHEVHFRDIVRPLWPVNTLQISAKYSIPRGSLQQLQTSAGMFYGMAYRFCEEMRFHECQCWFKPFKPALTACLSVRTLLLFPELVVPSRTGVVKLSAVPETPHLCAWGELRPSKSVVESWLP
jgi:hypothetical protein